MRVGWGAERSHSEAKAVNESDRKKFTAAYERIVSDALHDSHLHPPAIVSWMRKCIDYNIPGGKNTRGLSVLQVCTRLPSPLGHSAFTLLSFCLCCAT